MSEKARFEPGDRVIRMAPGSHLVQQFAEYEVERYQPATVDGLWLKGIPDRWNPDNFEKIR